MTSSADPDGLAGTDDTPGDVVGAEPSARRRAPRGHRAPAGEGDRLRTELLDAAEAELIRSGSAAQVSLRKVARTVGVSPTSVYLHFADRDQMLVAACQRRFAELLSSIQQARAAHDTPPAKLRACGAAYVRFGLEHPEHYALLFGGVIPMEMVLERLPPEELVGLQSLAEIADVVREGVASGDFRPMDPDQTAITLWALVHGLVGVISHGTDEPVDADALIDSSLDLIQVGLRRPS